MPSKNPDCGIPGNADSPRGAAVAASADRNLPDPARINISKPWVEVDELRARSALDPFLLAFHRTTDADAFWAALQNLLDAAFPSQSIVAALRVTGENPPVFYYTHHRPHHTHEWFSKTLAAHPCYAHLMANPGMPVLRLSEVLPPDILPNHPFYRQFMEPEDWYHGMAFVFWKDGQIDALIPVNRSRDQADFSDAELRLAHWLHPRIDAALHRVNTLLPITEAHRSLVSYFTDLPLPTLRLCWNLKLVFASRPAREMLWKWRNNGESQPGGSPGTRIRIPRDIRSACASIKQSILEARPAQWPPQVLPPPSRLAHPIYDGLSAVIRTTIPDRRPLSNPNFWIHLERSDTVNRSANMAALSLLSPAERSVAELLMTGLSNEEIAFRLNRSLSTVKAHLQSAFRKLGVNNRAGMIAKLHRFR